MRYSLTFGLKVQFVKVAELVLLEGLASQELELQLTTDGQPATDKQIGSPRQLTYQPDNSSRHCCTCPRDYVGQT